MEIFENAWIEEDTERFLVLLSNGNEIEKGNFQDDKKYLHSLVLQH